MTPMTSTEDPGPCLLPFDLEVRAPAPPCPPVPSFGGSAASDNQEQEIVNPREVGISESGVPCQREDSLVSNSRIHGSAGQEIVNSHEVGNSESGVPC